MFVQIKILIFLLIISLFFTTVYANSDELKKINEDLTNIKNLYQQGVLDDDAYNSAKNRLELKKQKLIDKKKKVKKSNTDSKTLEKQIEVLEKLLKDGVISKEEFEKSKVFLENKEDTGQNINLEDFTKEVQPDVDYLYEYKKDPGKKNWEKSELEYKNFKIITYRPGGIKIVRASDNKKLFHIVDNFKTKYFNGGEKFITFKKTVYNVSSGLTIEGAIKDATSDIKASLEDVKALLNFQIKKKDKPVWDKDAHKLELFIDGVKLLTFEGRYVKKHRAFFYQVLTIRNEPFHYYIKIKGKRAIALNMEFFNVKIDKAIRKAKKKLSAEYDVTEEEIQKIIDKQISQEMDKSMDDIIEQEMEEAINASVVEAIEQSVGQELSAMLVDAIEQATGEAIEQSIESELAAAIDAEIAYAVSIGIDEAAVTAGWEAYFEVLAQGGTIEEASEAAYDACGSACDNY